MADVSIGVNVDAKDASVKLEQFGRDGKSAFDRIKQSATESQQAALTWTQFLKGRMGPAMKEAMEGGASHADAHTVAMKQLSAQWKEYKRTAVSTNGAVAEAEKKSTAVTKTHTSALDRLKIKSQGVFRTMTSLKGLLISYGAIRFGRALLGSITSIEEGWTEVIKRTGLAGAELETFQEQIRNLSVEMRGIKLDELQQIAAVGGQLGVATQDLAEFTRVIAMTGVATNLTSEEAAQGLAKLGNVLDEPISKLEDVSSVMNALSNNSTASSSELVDFVKITGTMGKTLGLTTPEIFSLGATMKDMGLNTEVAGTAVLQVFSKLISNTEEFAKVAKLSTEEFSKLVEDRPIEAIKQLSIALSKMDKFEAVQSLSDLGLEGRRVLQTMLGLAKGTEKLNVHLDRASKQYKDGTSLQKEYTAASKTLISEATSTTNAFKILGEQIGEILLPALKKILPLITRSALFLRDLTKETIGFTKAVLGMDSGAKAVPRTLDNINKEIDILRRSIDGLSKSPGQGAADAVERLTGFLEVALKKQKELMDEASGRNGKSAGESLAKGLEGSPAIEVAVKNTSDFVEGAFDNIDLSLNNTVFSKFNQTLQDMEGAAVVGVENINIALSAIGPLSLPVAEDIGLSLDNTALIDFQQSVLDIKTDFFDRTLSLAQLTADREAEIVAEKNAKILENEKKVQDFRIFTLRATGTALANIELALSIAANDRAGAAFEAMKVASMAIAIVKTIEAAVSSYAAGAKIGGPVLGAVFAATAVAAGMAMVAQIAATQPGTSGVGGVGGDGGASPAPGATPGVETSPPPGGDTQPINMTVQIFNPLSTDNWDQIVEEDINPALGRMFDRNIIIAGT